jgi:hypothetical protein
MNPDGSRVRLLLAKIPGGAASLAWSPDGSKIAFLRYEAPKDRRSQLRACGTTQGCRFLVTEQDVVTVSMVEGDGSHLTRVLRIGTLFGLHRFASLAWSPDGTKLALLTDGFQDGGDGLYKLNPDGSGLRFVAPAVDGPAWRPVP